MCNECRKIQIQTWRSTDDGRAANARYRRNWHVRQYGITPEQYDKLFGFQGGVCAICGEAPDNGKSLAIDHCHETGRVRGLLCVTCNVHLGTYQAFRERAEKFLAEYGAGHPLLYHPDFEN